MCIGASVVEEVQDVVPMVDKSVCHRLKIFTIGLLHFAYPFHKIFSGLFSFSAFVNGSEL